MAGRAAASDNIKIRRSSYLSIPRHTLIDSLVTTEMRKGQITKGEAEDWQLFTRAMAFIVNCSYASVAEAMRKHAWEEENLLMSGRSAIELDELKLRGQLKYMQRLMSLVSAAQYSPLTEQHWAFGVEMQNFSSGQQVDCDLSFCKNQLFPAYFKGEAHGGGPYWFGPDCEGNEGKPPPDFANYVIVFFRGTTVLTETGHFIGEKLRYLYDMMRTSFSDLRRRRGTHRTHRTAQHAVFGDDSNSAGGSIFGAHKIDRVAVDAVIDRDGLFQTLFRSLELKEPAFLSLIVVHPSPEARIGTDSASAPAEPAQAADVYDSVDDPSHDDSEVSRVLRVEMFERVPFRDLGLVIPGRRVKIGFQHKLRFAVQVLVSTFFILLCLLSLEFRNSTRNWIVVCFLVSLLVGVGKQLHSMSAMQAGLQASVNDWLDQRRIASDNPCIARLMKQVEEQELKEIFLGYFFLWKRGPLTKRQLDREAETFLYQQHNLQLDFDVEDALKKLVHLRLIEEMGGKYRCTRRPRDYLDDPRPRWLDFFYSFGESGTNETVTGTVRQGREGGLRRRSAENVSFEEGTFSETGSFGRTLGSMRMSFGREP
eukprot:TRINITY_DN24484_c0_g1_i1.p1 TRINITY_DN24484_c0_g1~~TRINITY_DN24484_c0_g1_i1.p1  ORF type:complete len:609 (+),score=175.57 TRINITY_DN24484_c0_g1_i1:50-1828(+)